MTTSNVISWLHEMERHGVRFCIGPFGCTIRLPAGLTDPRKFPLGQVAAQILAIKGITEGFSYDTDSPGLPDTSGQSLHRRA